PVLIGAMITTLILTVSRGALYSAIVAIILLIVLTARSFKKGAALQLIGIATASVVIALLLSALPSVLRVDDSQTAKTSTTNVVEQASNFESQDDRVRNRDFAIQGFMGQPLVGIGPGNFSQYAKQRYVGYAGAEGYIIVNNEPLELLAEGGALSFTI